MHRCGAGRDAGDLLARYAERTKDIATVPFSLHAVRGVIHKITFLAVFDSEHVFLRKFSERFM